MDDFYLDTKKMDDVINQIQKMAGEMYDIKGNLQSAITSALKDWRGEGQQMFERKSYELLQKFTDIGESFYDIAEDLLTASTSYMEADTLLAKEEAGITNRY